MLWFVADHWELSLALLARKCGVPPACMSFMPVSAVVHDGMGAGAKAANLNADVYERYHEANALDTSLVDGVAKIFNQEVDRFGRDNLMKSAQCIQETQDCYIVYCQAARRSQVISPFCRYWALKDSEMPSVLGPVGTWDANGPGGKFNRAVVLGEWKLLMDRCRNVTARTCSHSADYSKWRRVLGG